MLLKILEKAEPNRKRDDKSAGSFLCDVFSFLVIPFFASHGFSCDYLFITYFIVFSRSHWLDSAFIGKIFNSGGKKDTDRLDIDSLISEETAKMDQVASLRNMNTTAAGAGGGGEPPKPEMSFREFLANIPEPNEEDEQPDPDDDASVPVYVNMFTDLDEFEEQVGREDTRRRQIEEALCEIVLWMFFVLTVRILHDLLQQSNSRTTITVCFFDR
jgi:hypothetical protein